ncbi:MAG: hypothetical protein HWD59_10820 [Coxiellaceae bacterium]|nr:MAG: hypothetical protein HWD59_10820 [Coxiellaceae bacterium]
MFIDDETGNVLITFSSKQSFESFVEYLKYVNDPRFDSEKIIGRSKYNDNKDSITSYWLSLSPAEYNIIWENENAYDELTGKSNQIIQFQ